MNNIENHNIIKSLLTIARNGKPNDFANVLSNNNEEVLSLESHKYFSELIDEESSEIVNSEDTSGEIESTSTNINKIKKSTSVLLTAISSRNRKICDFLIIDWTYLIQQLPFNHQVKISSVAFETGQLDVLCSLLTIADYPFPENFNIEALTYDKLNKIIVERTALETAIKNDNIHDIVKFIDKNSNLKIVYNINNKSALKYAVDASKLKLYIFLKFRGFGSTNPNEDFEKVDRDASVYAAQQRKQNVTTGLKDEKRSVNSLCNRSLIHNKRISKEQEKEYRLKIRNWYECIHKIPNGPEFLQVAASCERLKIIFDFENDTVSKFYFWDCS